MEALVLERKGLLRIREIDIPEVMGPDDVRIRIRTVGICGSDLHYYENGAIGDFVVKEPLVLGHEASGIIDEVGANVRHLAIGDRVCMEPGVPNPAGKAVALGMYNLDPEVRFWATPPIHGCLRRSVVHPAAYTYKLPEGVSLEAGAFVEPLAVGLHAATKASIKPGDIALVIGAGTIGIATALSALAGGCSRVIIADIKQEKLAIAAGLGPVTPVHVPQQDLSQVVRKATQGWGVDVIFEASGAPGAIKTLFQHLCPGGRVVFIGMPTAPVSFDIVAAQAKEARIETTFRYAHMYPRAIALLESGAIDVKPLISRTFGFADSIKAFDQALKAEPDTIKTQIVFP